MADDIREDTVGWPIMAKLSQCLCAELTKANLPELCFCGVLPGEAVALDYPTGEGCGGMGWVRLVTTFAAGSQFPAPDDFATCSTVLAVTLEVGVLRAAPYFDGRDLPTVEDQAAATSVQLADMAAIHRAIKCCMADADTLYALAEYQPVGPEGGVVGGAWTVTVQQAL